MWKYRRLTVKYFTRWALLAVALLVVGVFPAPALLAQDAYAAALRVLHVGVEVRRAQTDTWLPLRQDAQTTFGAGDQVRTNAAGRAWIAFEDSAVVLVMPHTVYELTAFAVSGQQIERLHARLAGRLIQRTAGTIADYRLETARAIVERPAALFIVQTQGDDILYLISARGESRVETQGQVITVAARQGLRAVGTLDERRTMTEPLRLSDLSVPADACQGLVRASPEPGVEIRTGPAEDYRSVGGLPNGLTIPLLGISEGGSRYLTPFNSGFGWVLITGIQRNCETLPAVPLDAVFPLGGVVNVQADEQPLLTPFFGLPADDKWFYTYD